MAALFGKNANKAKGKTKPIDEVEDDDEARATKFLKTTTKPDKDFDVLKNTHIDNGKIHVERLYAIFDQYRQNMSQSTYGAGNPFLMERRIATLRAELKRALTEVGLDKFIDFTFIPMPPVTTAGISANQIRAEAAAKTKGKKKTKAEVEDDDDED